MDDPIDHIVYDTAQIILLNGKEGSLNLRVA